MSVTYKEKNITIYTRNFKLNSNGIEKNYEKKLCERCHKKLSRTLLGLFDYFYKLPNYTGC